jgi:hypothetical protein
VCTLIAGLHVVGPRTLLLGANRDESPERPAAGPAPLLDQPRVVGGRDLRSGGTWLAVRNGSFVAALMNRRPLPHDARDPASLRSRGLLCLDLASAVFPVGAPDAVDPGTGERHSARLDAALRLLNRDPYAPCTLVGIGADGDAWAIHAGHGRAPETTAIGPGWHVITHTEVDDPDEPRTRFLVDRLAAERPRDIADATALLERLLRIHEGNGRPGVCLHRDRFPTVSSTILALGAVGRPIYRHAAGPPCVTAYEDVSGLLE